MLIQAKQIKKWLDAYVPMDNVAITYVATPIADLDITTDITTALATAGEGGVAVPLQPKIAGTQIGVLTDATLNKAELFNHATGKKINDGSGNEVYGRITEATGTYTLTFYSLVSGVETPYSFTTSIDLDIEFLYEFDLYRTPANASYEIRRTYTDLGIGAGTEVIENLPVTAPDTVTDLTHTPTTGSTILFVNHIAEDTLAGPGSASFSLIGTAITRSAINAGYALDTNDKITAKYMTLAI